MTSREKKKRGEKKREGKNFAPGVVAERARDAHRALETRPIEPRL